MRSILAVELAHLCQQWFAAQTLGLYQLVLQLEEDAAELLELTGVAAGEPFQQHLVGFLAVQCLVQHVQRPLRQHSLLADPALTSQGHSPIRLQRQRWGQQPILL